MEAHAFYFDEPRIVLADVDGIEPFEALGQVGQQLDPHFSQNAVRLDDAPDRQKMRLGRFIYRASLRSTGRPGRRLRIDFAQKSLSAKFVRLQQFEFHTPAFFSGAHLE